MILVNTIAPTGRIVLCSAYKFDANVPIGHNVLAAGLLTSRMEKKKAAEFSGLSFR